MADRPRAKLPWMFVGASVLLAILLLYVLFVGYLPAKHKVAGLERELASLRRRR